MLEVHDKVLAPYPVSRGNSVAMRVAEIVRISNSGQYLDIKFPNAKRYSKITISSHDVVKVAE